MTESGYPSLSGAVSLILRGSVVTASVSPIPTPSLARTSSGSTITAPSPRRRTLSLIRIYPPTSSYCQMSYTKNDYSEMSYFANQ